MKILLLNTKGKTKGNWKSLQMGWKEQDNQTNQNNKAGTHVIKHEKTEQNQTRPKS